MSSLVVRAGDRTSNQNQSLNARVKVETGIRAKGQNQITCSHGWQKQDSDRTGTRPTKYSIVFKLEHKRCKTAIGRQRIYKLCIKQPTTSYGAQEQAC